jgi:hypothetical protein
MSYDFDDSTDRSPPPITDYVANPKDLETIVVMLQLAAIFLTPSAGTIFTIQQLLDQVRELGGDDLVIEEKDIMIVLPGCSFLRKEKNGSFSMK